MDHFILVHLCVENQMGWWGYFAARSLFQVAHPSLLEQAWWLYAGLAEDPSQAGQQNPPTGQKSKFQCRWPRCSFMEISFLPCRYGSKTTQALPFTESHWTSLPKYHSHSNLMLCSAVLHWLISESLGLSWWGRQSAASQSAGHGITRQKLLTSQQVGELHQASHAFKPEEFALLLGCYFKTLCSYHWKGKVSSMIS